MRHNGWRKPTPGLVKAEKHAQAGERLSVPKARAIVAAKKIAAAIGLKSQDILLLDSFAAFTQAQDWEQGRRPIVWASNTFLMEQTGFSLPTLRRHVRRLCEAGIIWMKDSPNGKRWGRRDVDGVIIEAYGFDLAPLAARAEEFEALHSQLKEERQYCKSLRNAITVTRRVIRAKIEKAFESRLRGPWGDLRAQFSLLLDRLPKRSTEAGKLLHILDWFRALQEQVEAAFESAFDWPEEFDAMSTSLDDQTGSGVITYNVNMTPMGVSYESHILTTNKLNIVNSSKTKKNSKHVLQPSLEIAKPLDVNMDVQWSTHRNSRRSKIDISILMQTCPHFVDMAQKLEGNIHNWDHVHRAAGQMRGMMGITEQAWNVAQQTLGPPIAAATIALIYDKYCNGKIVSPGGYLRGMVAKAQIGELHLDRSFYARLNERKLT